MQNREIKASRAEGLVENTDGASDRRKTAEDIVFLRLRWTLTQMVMHFASLLAVFSASLRPFPPPILMFHQSRVTDEAISVVL